MEHQFHEQLKNTVMDFLRHNAYRCQQEYQLPNKKIADVIASDAKENIIIVEVKTSLHKCSLPSILDKYSSYCNALYVAGCENEIENLIQPPALLEWLPGVHRIGLLSVTGRSVRIARQAIPAVIPLDRAHPIAWSLGVRVTAW